MKALTFEYSIPKYLITGALADKRPGILNASWALARVRNIDEPRLPGGDWVKIRPKLSGLCGSDLSIIKCHESLTLQPFASFPFVLGHEVCGEIAELGEGVKGFERGDRVTVMPMLGCIPRGIEPVCRMCAQGRYALCENFTEGGLAPGMFEGSNRDTAGFISEMGVAHFTQLHKIPDGVSDESAVLTEPFATALHMVVDNRVERGETSLVYGCGVMGLCTIAGLRALHPDVRILAVEIDPFHSGMAKEMGADEVIYPGGKEFYKRIAELTGAKMYNPLMTKPILVGGVDRVFDAVGTTATVEASLRILASGGSYNLLGIGNPKGIDWTPVWFKELTIRGIYGYQGEKVEGEVTDGFEIALNLYSRNEVDLSRLVTHRFSLDQFPMALDVALNKGKNRAVKVTFTP